ncbi:MAG: hypothetical protein MUO91_03020, partial [candidate division Zixibacteria bacterium]|nr:hypothetical protein [candidate division Zixibacteria bacterium]
MDGFRLSIDQLLQARTGLEKFGYTSTDILKKRLSSFTANLGADTRYSFLKRSSNSFEKSRQANSHLNFAEKSNLTKRQTFIANISDMQVNNENYPGTFNQKFPCVSMFDDRNFVAVWEDERNGDIDIFAQKMNFYGAPAGNNFEVSEENFPKNQL